jgi:hypothetical protein
MQEATVSQSGQVQEIFNMDLGLQHTVERLRITERERERERLTAFCPSTVHRIPSDAFARQARIMYVGSIYFTSTGTPISLKHFFI